VLTPNVASWLRVGILKIRNYIVVTAVVVVVVGGGGRVVVVVVVA